MPKIYVVVKTYYHSDIADADLVPNVGLLLKEDTPPDAIGNLIDGVRTNLAAFAENSGVSDLRELTAEEIITLEKTLASNNPQTAYAATVGGDGRVGDVFKGPGAPTGQKYDA